MPRLEVRYRPEAVSDLEDIYRYIVALSAAPAVAQAFVSCIRSKCELIGDAPSIGIARDDLVPGLRLTSFERTAVIAYVIDGDAVRIVNVFYGGRDYEALFRD